MPRTQSATRRERLTSESSESSDSGTETVAAKGRHEAQAGRNAQNRGKATAASSYSGYLSGASQMAGWMANRAAGMVGLARPPMNETQDEGASNRAQRQQAVILAKTQPDASSFGLLSIPRWMWIPSNLKTLEDAETQCLQHLKSHVRRQMVHTSDGLSISTVTVQATEGVRMDINHPPLVLLHGFAGGAGIWCKNLDALAADRVVYAIDMVGFGRSSRPVFSSDAAEAEELFVTSLESWRRAMSLPSFILAGHSLGGFIAGSYALRHPGRVEHLLLVDCWGMPERPENHEEHRIKLPSWVRMLGTVVNAFSPLCGIRAVGPFGALAVRTLRPDLKKKYSDMFDDNTIPNYIYHLNAQPPSGEMAMKHLSIPFGWAKCPLLPRLLQHLDADLPMTLLFGQRSWIDCRSGYTLKEARPESYVDVRILDRAGHHIYSDRSDTFNEIAVEVCARVTDHLTSSAEEEDDEEG